MNEEHLDEPFPPQRSDELPHCAVNQQQYKEPDLYRPEAWPDNLFQQMAVGRAQAVILAEEMKKVFQVTHQQRSEEVDARLLHDVIDERLFRKAIDDRQQVRDEHYFGHDQRTNGRG